MNAGTGQLLSFACRMALWAGLWAPLAALPATNAANNGDWISVGVPNNMFVGSAGHFYMTGNDMGSCAATKPTYLRANMTATYWKELYTLFLYSHSQQKTLMCTVDTGCGSSEVWISYCRAALD
jgi:hypothetical protein